MDLEVKRRVFGERGWLETYHVCGEWNREELVII
jgi:hypothetical protein